MVAERWCHLTKRTWATRVSVVLWHHQGLTSRVERRFIIQPPDLKLEKAGQVTHGCIGGHWPPALAHVIARYHWEKTIYSATVSKPLLPWILFKTCFHQTASSNMLIFFVLQLIFKVVEHDELDFNWFQANVSLHWVIFFSHGLPCAQGHGCFWALAQLSEGGASSQNQTERQIKAICNFSSFHYFHTHLPLT